jgi:hypothetical protein
MTALLLMMPIIIETIASGRHMQFIMQLCTLFIQMMVLEGEMGPIVWVPTMVRAGATAMMPTSEPPDRPTYMTRGNKERARVSWWGTIVRKSKRFTEGWFDRKGTVSRLAGRGTSNKDELVSGS